MHTHAILSVALKPAALLEALCGALAEAGSVRSLLCILRFPRVHALVLVLGYFGIMAESLLPLPVAFCVVL